MVSQMPDVYTLDCTVGKTTYQRKLPRGESISGTLYLYIKISNQLNKNKSQIILYSTDEMGSGKVECFL